MRTVSIQTRVHRDPEEIYCLLADFRSYPQHMSSVRKVELFESAGPDCISSWEVEFRDGLLKWTERDRFSQERLRIEFSQIEGDLEVFYGYWQVTPAEDGCIVTFAAVFDLGIPSLAAFLEPVAQNALEENISKVIRGLFGDRQINVNEASSFDMNQSASP